MNIITIDSVANQIQAYLMNDVDIDSLVDWSEQAMMDGDFDPVHCEIIRDVIARLGVADMREFGLSWHECEQMLYKLGYQAHIDFVKL